MVKWLGTSNPAGVDINTGYYALLACIIGDVDVDTAIRSICKEQPLDAQAAVIHCYETWPGASFTDIAKRLNISEENVRYILRNYKNGTKPQKHFEQLDFNVLRQLVARCKKTKEIISKELGYHPKYLTRLLHNQSHVRRKNRVQMEQYFNVEEGTLLAQED